jgi:hypothetical protein
MRKSSSSFRRIAALCITAGLFAAGLTGCKGFFTPINLNGNGTVTSSYAYVLNTSTLAMYGLSSSGLTSLTGSPITLPVAGTAIAVAPNNAFLFVGTDTGVFLYTLNSDGTLTEGNGNQIIYLNSGIGTPIESMVVDQTSSWLLIAYQNSAEIDAVPIDPTSGLQTGAEAQIAKVKFSTPYPQLAISKANTQVFVAMGTGGTEEINFTATSTDPWSTTGTTIAPLGANNSDNAVAVDPTSTYLFIAEANSVATSTGTVRMIATANLSAAKDLDDEPTGVGPSSVLADLSGAYVYVANETDGTVSGYTIETASNTLSPFSATAPSEQSPIALVEDNSKTFILNVGNENTPNLWVYNFDATTAGLLDIKTTTSTGSTTLSPANGIAVTH